MNDFDVFEMCFFEDIESWFSADIACCDNCYDDFLSIWSRAYYANDCEFQKNSIDLDCFYSGSRLQQFYTKEEFDYYVTQISCSRCGDSLKGNIWAYELPFNVIPNFEQTIIEIGKIACFTPFLLLKHNFCQEVFSTIQKLGNVTQPFVYNSSLFRARIKQGNPLKQLSDFDFPPKNYVTEGRYNHAGNSVLYLASDIETCKAEMNNKECLAIEFVLSSPIKILNLSESFEHELESDLLDNLVYSALISAKQSDDGWDKPHYIFSRFIADCAKYSGFDAIKYPSTKRTADNFNLVLINNSLTLESCSKVISYHDI